MKITGLVKLFVEERIGKDNVKFNTFNTSISHKYEDGSYTNCSLEVQFSKELNEKAQKLISAKVYDLELEDSWLDTREYKALDGTPKKKIFIFVNKATLKGSKDIKIKAELEAVKNDNLPF